MNIGNPHEVTIRELAHMILKVTGSESSIVKKALPSDDPTRRQPDITLAREVLDWQPQVSLEEGLKRTTAYFRKLLDSMG